MTRTANSVVVTIFLLLFGSRGHVCAQIPVWIDTDAAPNVSFRDKDDLFALLVSFGSPELEIRGISVVFGNHDDIHAVLPDLRRLTNRFSRTPIMVHPGAESRDEPGKETEASAALADALRRDRLIILALGPLTNVATALQRHPEITNRIKRVVAVAGRRPQQEFIPPSGRVTLPDLNFESDVEAFRIVLETGIPLTLVPYEVSSQLWIALSDLQAMWRGSPAAHWLASQAAGWLDLWAHVIGLNGFNPFDALVLTYLISPDLLHCQTNVPAAIQSVPAKWWKFWLFGSEKPVLAVSSSVDSPRRVEYCFGVDLRAKRELLLRIDAAGNGSSSRGIHP